MFAPVILVAIFSSALPFEAEAQHHLPKCNQDTIRKIYAYWNKNGGIPQHITERKIRCEPREIPFLSTQNFYDEGVTCAVVDHFARSHTITFLKGNEVSYVRKAVVHEFNGQVIDPLNEYVAFEIAQCEGAKLLHVCTRRRDAKEGPSQFVIKGTEGKVTEKGIKDMQDLLASTFECNETLRTYPDCSCSLLNEKTHPVEAFCPDSSCTSQH